MNIDLANKIVIRAIVSVLGIKPAITEEMQLIGGESLLDSMKLVELLIDCRASSLSGQTLNIGGI